MGQSYKLSKRLKSFKKAKVIYDKLREMFPEKFSPLHVIPEVPPHPGDQPPKPKLIVFSEREINMDMTQEDILSVVAYFADKNPQIKIKNKVISYQQKTYKEDVYCRETYEWVVETKTLQTPVYGNEIESVTFSARHKCDDAMKMENEHSRKLNSWENKLENHKRLKKLAFETLQLNFRLIQDARSNHT